MAVDISIPTGGGGKSSGYTVQYGSARLTLTIQGGVSFVTIVPTVCYFCCSVQPAMADTVTSFVTQFVILEGAINRNSVR